MLETNISVYSKEKLCEMCNHNKWGVLVCSQGILRAYGDDGMIPCTPHPCKGFDMEWQEVDFRKRGALRGLD